MMHATLDNWIRHEAIPFSVDSSETFNACIDRVIASLDDSVELLGFGEALHGGEDIIMLRNRFFQRLVKMHGYSAIAIESSFPRARVVNDYMVGRGPASYEAVQDAGFSHGFGLTRIENSWSGCGDTMPILPGFNGIQPRWADQHQVGSPHETGIFMRENAGICL